MSSEPSVRLERLGFAYGEATPIVDGADLRLPAGWTGLTGENGAGKSTLLALLAGDLAPTAGRVALSPPGARVVRCPQEVSGPPGPDVLALAVREDGAGRALRGRLGLRAEGLARWPTLSPGERKRWQLGAALAAGPDVLLLDEPTNHADEAARALLLDALRAFRGIGVVVSHDRALLEALTVRTLRLHRGALRLHGAAYGAARRAWEAEASQAWEARAAGQAAARRAEARLAAARQARAEADRARSNRHRDPKDREARSMGAKTLRAWAEDRLGRDVARQRGAAERARADVPEAPASVELGRTVFLGWERPARPTLLSLSTAEVRAGPAVVLRDVSFRLGREDRVRLAGPNGAGKSTLLAALLAASSLPPGRLLVLPQELGPGAGAALLAEVRAQPPEVRGRVLSLLAALGSDPARLLASRDPSPGEARKLHLALGLGRHAWGLVLDEPTNHLDLPTVERLEVALAAYPGAILLVTHDDHLAAACTGATWRISGGRLEAGPGTASPGPRRGMAPL